MTWAAAGLLLACLGGTALQAQDAPSGTGVQAGGYQIQQSLDTGYRYSSVTGSLGNYQTFVNQGSGIRLLSSAMEAHAIDNPGSLFDNLSLTSAGLGGDPQDSVRLHVDKGRLYDFNAVFRRDKNIFDYNLLANPLNPTTYTPATGTSNTLHELDLSHRMQDYNLRLFPLSKVSIRLGYSNNIQTGPADTTLHGNVDTQLLENYSTTMNSYRFGVDWKPIARTLISFDEFREYFKSDTGVNGVPTTNLEQNGVPVDLGFVYNGTTPCASSISNAATHPPTVIPNCKGYLSYSRVMPGRTNLPTEHADLHSNYLKSLDLTGSFSYNSGQATVPGYVELVNGLTSVTRGTNTQASTLANRVEMDANGAAVWKITDQLRLVDTFRMNRFENPGDYSFNEQTIFAQGPLISGTGSMLLPGAVFNLANCPSPYTALTCPQHTTSSAADEQAGITYNYLGDNEKHDSLQLTWEFRPGWSAHVGYGWSMQKVADGQSTFTTLDVYDPGSGATLADRGSCALKSGVLPTGCTLNSDGSVTYVPTTTPTVATPAQIASIHGDLWTAGLVFRPSSKLRFAYDDDFYTANHAFARIDPLNSQRYSLHADYKPTQRLDLNTSMVAFDSADPTAGVNQLSHNRAYDATAGYSVSDNMSFEVGYGYNNIYSQANICFSLGTSVAPSWVGACQAVVTSPVTQGTLGYYSDLDHFYYANIAYKPTSRLATRIGWAANYTRGSTPLLNPLAPQGPLQYDYLRPWGTLDVTTTSHLTARFAFNYYDYRELGTVNIAGLAPIFGDNFHANLLTSSLRYTF